MDEQKVELVRMIQGVDPTPKIQNGVIRVQNRSAKGEDGQYRSVLEWNLIVINGEPRRIYQGTKMDYRIGQLVKLAEKNPDLNREFLKVFSINHCPCCGEKLEEETHYGNFKLPYPTMKCPRCPYEIT